MSVGRRRAQLGYVGRVVCVPPELVVRAPLAGAQGALAGLRRARTHVPHDVTQR